MPTYSSRPCQKPGCFGEEAVDVGEALVPHVDGNIDNVCHKTEGGERRMQEEGVETPFVSVVCNEKYGIQCNRHE